jgi:hypothetical protein
MKRRRQRGRGRRGVRAPASAPRTDQLLNEWVSWLVDDEGLSPAEAEEYRSVILDFQRRTGLSDLTSAKREDIERYLDETDREDLEWLRGELERLGEADPEPEH